MVTSAPSIRLVDDGDEWQGLYINGILVDQNHSFSAGELLHHLAAAGLDAQRVEWNNPNPDEGDGLPAMFAEVTIKKGRR